MEARTLSQVLQKLSPSAVLDLEDSKQDFHWFFLRGTPEQCWKLIPAQYRPSDNANFSLPQLPPTQASLLDQLSSRSPSIQPALSKEPVLHPTSYLISSNSYHQPAGKCLLPCPNSSSSPPNSEVGINQCNTLSPSKSSPEPQSLPPKKR
ncbi:hypothetical protein I7I53_08789 [Histoplasma capsulatum var. duboisii H88]|uniref:Uncharacterized protein n=1 Tax=Ajellomyces capsulatus (strain H88) TaxID=544711 RepID=A0A8A1L7S7_AJEC8|nr:hypothetical protein I7I53_08789 [Histoplasma capsulatum var. duboisii H88]